MKSRYCGHCGKRLRIETSRGGIPRQVCPNCSDGVSDTFTGP